MGDRAMGRAPVGLHRVDDRNGAAEAFRAGTAGIIAVPDLAADLPRRGPAAIAAAAPPIAEAAIAGPVALAARPRARPGHRRGAGGGLVARPSDWRGDDGRPRLRDDDRRRDDFRRAGFEIGRRRRALGPWAALSDLAL